MPRVIGTGLHVQDLARSVDFYTQVLGMKETARYELESLTEVVMTHPAVPDAATVMLLARTDHVGPPADGDGLNKLMFAVDDVRAACELLAAWGGEIEKAPAELAEHGVTMAMV